MATHVEREWLMMSATILDKAAVSRLLKAATFLHHERWEGASVLMREVWELELTWIEATYSKSARNELTPGD